MRSYGSGGIPRIRRALRSCSLVYRLVKTQDTSCVLRRLYISRRAQPVHSHFLIDFAGPLRGTIGGVSEDELKLRLLLTGLV